MPADPTLAAVLEPRRRAILRLLAERPQTVGELASGFEVSRPAISQHLAVLRAAGLVTSTTSAGRSTYRVLEEGLEAGRRALGQVAEDLPGEGAPAGPVAADPSAIVLAVPVGMPAGLALAHFTDGDLLVRWLGERAELDPRPGGTFRVELGGGDVAAGAYEEAGAARTVFTWGAEGAPPPFDPGSSRVAVDVEAGETVLVRLTHTGLPGPARGPHLATWARHLAALAALS